MTRWHGSVVLFWVMSSSIPSAVNHRDTSRSTAAAARSSRASSSASSACCTKNASSCSRIVAGCENESSGSTVASDRGGLELAGQHADIVAEPAQHGDPLLGLQRDAVDAADAADHDPDPHAWSSA